MSSPYLSNGFFITPEQPVGPRKYVLSSTYPKSKYCIVLPFGPTSMYCIVLTMKYLWQYISMLIIR